MLKCLKCEKSDSTVQSGLGWATETHLCSSCRKELIFNTLSDRVLDLIVYGRREDEELGEGEIDREINEGRLNVDELVARFKAELEQRLKANKENAYRG